MGCFVRGVKKWHGMFCPGMFCPAPQPHASTRTFAHMRTHARLHTNIEVRKIRDVHIIHTHIHTHECTLAHRRTGITFMLRTV